MSGPLAFGIRIGAVAIVTTMAAVLTAGISDNPKGEDNDKLRATPIARIDRAAQPPIEMEAHVFRVTVRRAAMAEPVRRSAAHARTLATFRGLRAYPGAPPRVPHGLTADEFRGTRCRACHERGGYSKRFESYAPVTPHPQLVNCLQCHLADDALVGTGLPRAGGEDYCRQCHAPGAARRDVVLSDAWRALPWPAVAPPQDASPPPVIPHDLSARAACLVCHAGPGAVEEIRTTHPERLNCRQCHLGGDQ